MNENIIGALVGIAIAAVIVAIMVAVFRWLWNTTMPEVFGLRELSFWQAFKIMLLAGILFGGHRAMDVPQQISEETAPAAVQSE
ncbi:MAG: hypothetical protein WBN95_04210 [Gammaproteobacteria bacterium]|jgi:hypothetical protein